MPSLDLGAGLSEKNKLSVKDEYAPIKINNRIQSILSEVDEKKPNVTELERWQQEKQNSKTRKKYYSSKRMDRPDFT